MPRNIGLQSQSHALMVYPASSYWMKLPQTGTVTAGTPTAATMFLCPLFPNRNCTLAQLAYEITTQGVSASGTDRLRFGIYNANTNTGEPTGAPLVDLSDVDLEATVGVKVFDCTNQALVNKLYWFAMVRQTTGSIGTASQVRLQVGFHENSQFINQSASTPAIGGDGGAYGYFTQTGVTGALPSIGTLAGSSGSAPVTLLQMA